MLWGSLQGLDVIPVLECTTSQPWSAPPCLGDGTWQPAPGLRKHRFVQRQTGPYGWGQAGTGIGVPGAPSTSSEQCLLPGRCSARAVAGKGLIQPIPGSPDVAKPWGSPLQPAQHSLLPSPLPTRCWGWRMKALPAAVPAASPSSSRSGAWISQAGSARPSLCPPPPRRAALIGSGPAALPSAGRGWRQPGLLGPSLLLLLPTAPAAMSPC